MAAEEWSARVGRRRRIRVNFATRLLIGGLVLSVGLIAVVSAFLLISRSQQTNSVALSNADNRAEVVRGLIQRVTAPQARTAAQNAAGLAALRTAMEQPDQAGAVARLFAGRADVVATIPNEYVIILGAAGVVLHTTEPAALPRISASAAGVREALAGRSSEGVEVLGGGYLVYDLAMPVNGADDRSVTGAVVYSVPLDVPLNDLAPAVGYPTAMFPATSSHVLLRVGTRGMTQVRLPAQLEPALSARPDLIDATYSVPGVGDVAASFVALGDPLAPKDPKGPHVAAYVGVEVPLQPFFENQGKDEMTLLLLGLTASAVVALAVLLFVNRFVRGPVGRLGEGVARIAGGDYTSDIPVESGDELGLLAAGVNRMRLRIAGYVRHVDGAIARLGEVSHALTATAGGVEMLEHAVCDAAAAIAGGGSCRAYILGRRGEELVARTEDEAAGSAHRAEPGVAVRVLGGALERVAGGTVHRLFVPMFYQGSVAGAVLVVTDDPPSEVEERALVALANNAAIAIENTRLFEQEKETVARLRKLDALKSDFLATAQHELRTPVTAIRGQLDLLNFAWPQWDDAMKLSIIGEIEVSTRLLGELLESIIDFSLLSAERLELKLEPTEVGPAIEEAIDEVAHHFVDTLPVTVNVGVPKGVAVTADPERLRQVLRCLLDNAVKFTPAGGRVDAVAALDGTGLCRIDIMDNGIGIDVDSLHHVFERFFQANNTRTRSFGGLGMGLALAAELCTAHGATITVASLVGRGTKFTLLWPAVAGGDPVPPDGGARSTGPAGASHAGMG